jgi:hypothetical protein
MSDVAPQERPPVTPPPLAKGYKSNFQTLLRAAANGDLALLSAVRKADGKPVALVCAMNVDVDETGEPQYMPAPIAEMISGNPWELYYDPVLDAEEKQADG